MSDRTPKPAFATGLMVLAALLICGCGGGPKLYTVTGTVTYQGKPVQSGQIVFADATTTGPTATAAIKDGQYKIRCTAGDKKVRITATQETGKMVEGAMGATYPETIDLIPPQYNTATTLQCKVGPDEDPVCDFSLE